MKLYEYEIVLSTPIGDRKGVLSIKIDNDRLEGVLSVLEQNNDVSGRINTEGICFMEGGIKTIVQTIPFQAEGELNDQSIHLVLHTVKDNMMIIGQSKKGECSL